MRVEQPRAASDVRRAHTCAHTVLADLSYALQTSGPPGHLGTRSRRQAGPKLVKMQKNAKSMSAASRGGAIHTLRSMKYGHHDASLYLGGCGCWRLMDPVWIPGSRPRACSCGPIDKSGFRLTLSWSSSPPSWVASSASRQNRARGSRRHARSSAAPLPLREPGTDMIGRRAGDRQGEPAVRSDLPGCRLRFVPRNPMEAANSGSWRSQPPAAGGCNLRQLDAAASTTHRGGAGFVAVLWNGSLAGRSAAVNCRFKSARPCPPRRTGCLR
jgi:hypothetical protein